jgi:hypothetical protein
MRRWWMIFALTGLTLLTSQVANAQSSRDRDDEEDQDSQNNYALAVGAGLVEAQDTETYLMAALRIRVNRRSDEDERDAGGGIRGYIEPEIGYWKSSNDLVDGSDTLVGANLVGVVPFGKIDSFYGAGIGAHFLDSQLVTGDPNDDGSETKLGLNAQFGVDIYLSRTVSLFGAGRFDLVQGDSKRTQSKVYLGVRGRF